MYPKMTLLFLRNVDLQTLLNNKECRMLLELARIDQFKIEVAQQPWYDLVDLEEGQIATNAEMAATTKLCQKLSASIQGTSELYRDVTHLEHIPLHPPCLFRITQPPLWAVALCVLSECCLVPVQHPAVHSDGHASREEVAIQLSTLRWHSPCDVQPDSGPNPHGLLETRLEIVKVLRLIPRDIPGNWDGAVGCGLADLFLYAGVDTRVGQDVEEERLHG